MAWLRAIIGKLKRTMPYSPLNTILFKVYAMDAPKYGTLQAYRLKSADRRGSSRGEMSCS